MKFGWALTLGTVVTLSLGPPVFAQDTVVVSGRVTTEQGEGIPDVTVTAHHDGMWWDRTSEAVTSSDGSYQLVLDEASYAFSATPPRASDYVMKVYPDGPSCIDDNWPAVAVAGDMGNIDFELLVGGRLAFTLLDDAGSPLEIDITAVLFSLDMGWCFTFDSVTLSQGAYLSPAVDSGDYRVRIDTPSNGQYPDQYLCGAFDDWAADTVTLNPGATLDFGSCRLLNTDLLHEVSGRVTDSAGIGLGGVGVAARLQGSESSVAASTVTDEHGGFVFQVEEGPYIFSAIPPRDSGFAMRVLPDGRPCIEDFSPHAVTIDGPVSGVDFTLVEGGRLEFTLLEADGTPVDFEIATALFQVDESGCYVPDVSILDQGNYISPFVAAGNYRVRIDSPGHDEYPDQQYFCGVYLEPNATTATITSGSMGDLGECTLLEGSSDFLIGGRVLGPDDAAIPGFTVRGYSQSLEEVVSTTTGGDGSYLLAFPEGLVAVSLRVDEDPTAWFVGEVWDNCSCENRFVGFQNEDPLQTEEWCIDFLPGGVDRSDLDFSLKIGGRLQFQLLDQRGFPINFACPISLERIEPHVDPYGETRDMPVRCHDLTTENDGTFLSPLLSPGKYRIAMFPPEGSGFLQQAYCQLEWQGGFGEVVEPSQITDLGSCRLLPDDIEIHTDSGYLFSFDDDWLLGRPQIVASTAASADLNDDELVDIVVGGTGVQLDCQSAPGSPAQTVYVFINHGGNVFSDETATWVPFDYCGGPNVHLADFNCDGFPDLGIADYGVEWADGTPWGGQDTIWKNINGQFFEDTTGSWIPLDNPWPEEQQPSYGTSDFQLFDLDRDGDIDILRPTPKEQILLNDGLGSFTVDTDRQYARDPSALEALRSQVVTMHDLDADGIEDLIVVDYDPLDPEENQPLRLFRGLGDGTFQAFTLQSVADPLHLDLTAEPFRTAAWDFDGDGSVEIYVGYLPNSGNLDGLTFGTSPFDQLYEAHHVGEDALVVNDVTAQVEQTETLNGTYNLILADFDNDEDMDIVIGDNDQIFNILRPYPDIRILVNQGDGRFSPLPATNFPAFNATPNGLTILDADNDGDLDIFIGANPLRSLLFVNRLLEKHDLNGDSYVTPSDVQLVVNRLGTSGPGIQEDLNEDGIVDALDVSLILRYQTTTLADNSTFIPACVPESFD